MVSSAGAVTRGGAEVTSVTNPSTGVYNVTFGRAVDTCGYLVSVFGAVGGGGTPDNGEASAMSGSTAAVVVVRTSGADGSLAARNFSLAVVC